MIQQLTIRSADTPVRSECEARTAVRTGSPPTNPYSAIILHVPANVLILRTTHTLMEIKPKRPIAVWIAQIAMILFSLAFQMPLFYLLFLAPTFGISSLAGLAIMIAINLCFSLLSIVAFWGMAR